jgi:Iap family predicted aminopeptidase
MNDIKTEIMKHLEQLCVRIGPRPVGSAANQTAADYIRRIFEESDNNSVVKEQSFAAPVWEKQVTCLEFDGEKLAARANVFSLPGDVAGPMVAMGTLAELEVAELAGRIALMHGELTQGGISARNAIYFPEQHQRIMELLEQKQPQAVITVNSKVGCFERIMVDAEFPIPSVTVPAEVGLVLLRHRDRSVRLKIDGHRSPGQYRNIVGRKVGDRPEWIVLCAHFDTKLETPGAWDNASGVAVLLALVQTLAKKELAIGVEWVAFNGEEMGGLGDVEYWRQRAAEIDQILGVINVDAVGQSVGVNSVTAFGGSQSWQEHVADLVQRYPGVAWVEPWYESNHSGFLWRGIPCVAVSSLGSADVLHLPTDTIDWMSPAKLVEVVLLVSELVDSLQGKPVHWGREAQ